MTSYIVSYDLNFPGQDYSDLHDAIKSYGWWWHHLDSTWIIKTDQSAEVVRDYLVAFIDSNDKLLVAELTGAGAWAGFNSKGSKWLSDNL